MASTLRSATRRAEGATHRRTVARKRWFRVLGRLGLLARAVIYLVLSILTWFIAFQGRPPAQASGEGALAEVARQPAGPFLLGFLAVGLLAYAGWRATQVVTGAEPAATSHRGTGWRRIGWLVITAAYVALFVKAVSLMVGSSSSGSGSGPSSHPQPYVGKVLAWPGGQVWLALAGVTVCIVGVVFAVWGVTHDYRHELEGARVPRSVEVTARLTGAYGNLTRAALVVLVGAYLLAAAVDGRRSEVKSVDQVLRSVARDPKGPLWLGVIAAGLLAFAVCSAIEAVWRRL